MSDIYNIRVLKYVFHRKDSVYDHHLDTTPQTITVTSRDPVSHISVLLARQTPQTWAKTTVDQLKFLPNTEQNIPVVFRNVINTKSINLNTDIGSSGLQNGDYVCYAIDRNPQMGRD